MPVPPIVTPTPGLQASSLDIIKGAMRAVNILSSGENPTASEADDYLAILNQMIDGWNSERLMIFTVNRIGPFNLTPGKQTYTVGPAALADIKIARPPRIELITILWLGNPIQPSEIGLDMLDEQGWAAIPVKNIGAPLPQKVWLDEGFPLRMLSFWPFPTITIQTVFYGWQALTAFPDLATKMTFPPGYLEALRFNLAIRLDNAEVTPVVAKMADDSRMKIKSFNSPILTVVGDTDGLGSDNSSYNWLTDLPVIRGRSF